MESSTLKPSRPLTPSPLLAKNTLLNLVGYGAPLLVAIVCIPKIVAGLGTDRFGILTLAWVLIGYFGLLDLGLGRALTQVVAERLGSEKTHEIPATIWTALLAMLSIAAVICLVLLLSGRWLIHDVFNVPVALEEETFQAFIILVLFIPVVTASVGLRGILEAYQRFDLVNLVRVPLGIFTFVAPLAVIPFSARLPAVVLVLCAGRTIAAVFQFALCCSIVENLVSNITIDTQKFGLLMRFGGWMTVTNVISPLLVYLDRFLIGTLISVTAVAYYATPSEVITKLTLISGALMSVLFPAISSSFKLDRQHSRLLLERGLKYVFLAILPLVLLIATFAPEGLSLWLDDQFMHNSTRVTRILAVGILFTCLGQIPYAFIQGAGRPDLTAKLHLVELPLYLALLGIAIHLAGIEGAALAWTFRFVVDALLMYLLALNLLGGQRSKNRLRWMIIAASLAGVVILASIPGLAWRLAAFLLTIALFCGGAPRRLLSLGEKEFLKKTFRDLGKGHILTASLKKYIKSSGLHPNKYTQL